MKQTIDENLYSRQLYVLGTDAMAAFQRSHVLVAGLTGLGQEVAKNIILAGINKVTLYDPRVVTIKDLSAGFYFSYEMIDDRRDFSLIQKMKGLNPYVDVDILSSSLDILSDDFISFVNESEYTLVVLAGLDYAHQVKIKNHKLISCQINGLVSQVFVDFQDFIVKDQNGEPCLTGIVNDVTEDGILTMIDGERHNLDDNATIKLFRNNEDCFKEYKIMVITPYKLHLMNYSEGFFLGGSFEEIKVHREMGFNRLEVGLVNPTIVNECDMSQILHNCYYLLDSSYKKKPEEFISYYKNSIPLLPFKIYSEEILRAIVYMYDIEIMPMASIIGGFVAQEVLKGCSGKFTPLHQFMYYDAFECLQMDNDPITKSKEHEYYREVCFEFIRDYFKDINHDFISNSRYYSYEKLFGHAAFEAFKNATGFIVGAGAIGCEHLKNIIMSGIGLESKLFLTDMDSIEQSNLNRQFLFRQKDVGRMKSEIAIREVKALNQDYGDNRGDFKNELYGFIEKVGPETENLFSDSFYDQILFVANALDNIDARKYVDSRIILNKKPLFESGTLGTKGNTQVILPDKTESYSSSNDPPEKSIPLCTLRNFPNMIEHTIEFALSEFKNSFSDKIISIKDYLKKEDHESIKGENIGEDIEEMVKAIPENLDDCVRSAFDLFFLLFYVQINKLLRSFPADHMTEQGILFWSAPKRPPVAIEFDINNEMHNLFIYSAAKLYKNAFGIEGEIESINIEEYFMINKEHIFNKADMKINAASNSSEVQQSNNVSRASSTSASIEDISVIAGKVLHKLAPIEFEKDNDGNSHVDFIYACANIRAQNYKIKEANRLTVKGISGRIIPAIATTTALVSGLSILEIYKYILQCPLESFRNSYVNLALPMLTSSEPLPPLKQEYYFNPNDKMEQTLWDRIEFDDMTLQEFFDICAQKYNITVDMVTVGSLTIWLAFVKSNKYDKYLNKKFSEVVDHVEGRKYLHLGVLFNNECESFPSIVVNLDRNK